MEKNKNYKLIFRFAKEFLYEIVANYPELTNNVIKEHFRQESKFDSIQDACCRLILSLQNRNMMASVIGFNRREEELKSILFGFDTRKILATYKDADELLEKFKEKFNLQNVQGKRSLWRKFSEGIISGSKFMASFKDKDDFDSFVKTFNRNKYTKAALPMLLSREINGFGFALACDFLKELGYREYPKPDIHLIKIFSELGLSESTEPYDVYKSIIEMAEAIGEDAYTVDKIFWLISSGMFYLTPVRTGRNRDRFIKEAKKQINTGF